MYLCINKTRTIMKETKTIIVRFKETYMPHPVERICTNMTKDQIIRIYGLEEPDIEWYEFMEGYAIGQ